MWWYVIRVFQGHQPGTTFLDSAFPLCWQYSFCFHYLPSSHPITSFDNILPTIIHSYASHAGNTYKVPNLCVHATQSHIIINSTSGYNWRLTIHRIKMNYPNPTSYKTVNRRTYQNTHESCVRILIYDGTRTFPSGIFRI